MRAVLLWSLLTVLAGCTSPAPLPPVAAFDLDRYMGRWYVIAHIPPPMTGNAFNAVEEYERVSEQRVDTRYSFNRGAFDGPRKVMHPTGFPGRGDSPAHWGMQFLWPFRADYRIAWIDDAYQEVIVAREQRDYLWIMAREPLLAPARIEALTERAVAMGYQLDGLEMVPQQSLAERVPLPPWP
ncbi:MAG: lipocalin family protein [Pseudomonadota bacterium]